MKISVVGLGYVEPPLSLQFAGVVASKLVASSRFFE